MPTANLESNLSPKVVGVDGVVVIQLGEDAYLRMPADTADEFARQILVAAAKSRGETGHVFIVPVSNQ